MERHELGQQLNLTVELIPQGMPNRKGSSIAPTYLTIHNTSNTGSGADAAAHSRFVRKTGFYTLASGKKNYVSWHYTVDDQQVIKHLPINERAIHAGSGNGRSIGIEICMHKGIDQKAANLRATKLVAVLMHDLGIKKDHIVTHKHWTNKNCPTLLLSDFEAFRDRAAAIRASITSSDIEVEEMNNPVISRAEFTAIAEAADLGIEQGDEDIEDDPINGHDRIAEALNSMIAVP